MTKASDNPFPSILIDEEVDPAAPAAGHKRLFIDSADHKLKTIDSSSAVVDYTPGAGGDVATDAIWDAAGDLAVGSGANTAAKLTKGSDGDVLTISASTHVPVWAAPAAGATLVSDKKSRVSTDITFNTTSFAVIDTNLNITLTTGARRCLVGWTLVAKNNAAGQQQVDVEIDSSRVGQTFGLVFQGAGGNNANANLAGSFLTDVLSAGEHVFKLMFRVDGNTSTIYASSSISPIIFWVMEQGG